MGGKAEGQNKIKGFSLIEVLVFITILSVVFIAAAALGTASIRNSQTAENKILATRYAEELMDWLRGEKEADWEAFSSKGGYGTDIEYCFDEEPVASWPASGLCGSTDLISGTFERTVALNYDDSLGRVNIAVRVEWTEGTNPLRVDIGSVFTQREDL